MAAERSLERIGADAFDLLLLHNPDRTGYSSEAVWNGMRAAKRAKDLEGFMLIAGVTLAIGMQALINLSVVTGLLPTKGISLPFISSGGSSLVIFMSSVGLMLNAVGQSQEDVPVSMTDMQPEPRFLNGH